MNTQREKEIKDIYQLRVITSEAGKKRETHFVLYTYLYLKFFTSMYYFYNLKRKFKITKGGKTVTERHKNVFI